MPCIRLQRDNKSVTQIFKTAIQKDPWTKVREMIEKTIRAEATGTHDEGLWKSYRKENQRDDRHRCNAVWFHV